MSAVASKSIRQLNDEAKALVLEVKALVDKGDDATPEDQQAIIEKTGQIEVVKAALDQAGQQREEALKALNRIENSMSVLAKVDRPYIAPAAAAAAPAPGGDGVGISKDGRSIRAEVPAVKSVGDLVFDDEQFSAWYGQITARGFIAERSNIGSPRVAVKTLYTGAIDRTASGPLLGVADRRPEVVPYGWAQLVLRQLVTNLTTNSDLVEVVRESAYTNNAAIVAEATATDGTSGTKPESAVTWEVIQAPVRTIAHWVPVTSRILADANRLRGEIDNFLRQGLDQAVEKEVLTGDGSGEHFDGINHVSGTLSQTYVTLATSGQSMLATTRKARTLLKVTGTASPTAFLFHPNDWEELDLTQDAEDRFYFGGPFALGTPRLWGLPVVESVHQTENTGICADFRDVVLYDREQSTIAISNQHSDFFIRNMVAILAELRLAMHVRRPRSIAKIALA